MITKRSKFILASAVGLVLFTSVIPRGVYKIKNISLVQEAQAQNGGGIMQNIMPILMLLMIMNMMQQNKGNQLQREQADAARNSNANLLNAGNQSNGGGANGVAPNLVPNTNPPTNPITNPIVNPNGSMVGVFIPR